jgi:hypothetical protein
MFAYAFTIFTGAFLLFQVQPLIGKYILPWFGGGPGVWSACMLFFQLLLLGGYAYAHFLGKLPTRKQVTVHGILLVASLVLLPIIPSDRWRPEGGADPTLGIIELLAATVGLPYFVLSTTGPLMQRWFSLTHPGKSPYRLYALSNFGSLLALISYPFVFEPAITRVQQAHLWSVGLVIFAASAGWCAWRLRKLTDTGVVATEEKLESEQAEIITPYRRFLWLILPACASASLLATTNKLCQDVAVIPFLWVLPLCLYLLTFIVAFDNPRWYLRRVFGFLMIVSGIALMLVLLEPTVPAKLQSISFITDFFSYLKNLSMQKEAALFCGALFVSCMACHGELYRLRPSPRHLTSFFLMMSAGGALGGIFVALIAPLIFDHYYEFHLTIVAAPLIFLLAVWHDRQRYQNRLIFDLSLGATLGLVFFIAAGLVAEIRNDLKSASFTQRNFYGALTVFDYYKDEPNHHYRVLQHGKITHGLQFMEPLAAKWATSYYSDKSGIGMAITHFPRQQNRRVGLVGLGTGSMCVYGQPGDYLRIYEINPIVVDFATNYFTYLRDSQYKIDIALGDARLTMEKELERGEAQQFDIIALDAFSSDAIPAHLLTVEAIDIYRKHLKPDGVIVIHVSNRYLDLHPVVLKLAENIGWRTATIDDNTESDEERSDKWWFYDSTWILVSQNAELMDNDAIKGNAYEYSEEELAKKAKSRLWTDDYTALFEVLY